jgi:nucleoid-associated protein YgaU
MTSDAKIGLLLGLVFIFVIAFIINGLPNFGSHSQAEATPMSAFRPDKNLGVAASAQNAQEQLDWDALLAEESDALADVQSAETEAEPPETVVAAEGQDARSVYTLDSLMGGVSRTIEDVVNRFAESSRSTPLQVEASEPPPTISVPEPNPSRATPAERPGTGPTPKFYVVQDGDILATVAKKAYGLEEGNRLVNIKLIFEANRMTLESPDEIRIGQKLIIPPLPKAGAAGKVEPALSEALFEKVQDIGRRNRVETGEDKPQGRFYVVQDGDNLWKIATGQLGDGARCEEIVKLNADVLKSKDTILAIGMRLRLPAK